jgi:hypothetical protein
MLKVGDLLQCYVLVVLSVSNMLFGYWQDVDLL